MRRIITKAFQFNKGRFIFTVETDNLCWYLKCYTGSSEKNNEVDLSELKDLKARILQLVREEYGHSLSGDLFKAGTRISPDLRKYFSIPFPISHDLQLLIDELDGSGGLICDIEPSVDIIDYLTAHDIPYIEFMYKGKHYIFTSNQKLNAFQEDLIDVINEKRREMKEMSDLLSRLTYSSGKLTAGNPKQEDIFMSEPTWKHEINNIKNCPQRQDSITDQMKDLYYVANKLGFYDAADFIKQSFIDKR